MSLYKRLPRQQQRKDLLKRPLLLDRFFAAMLSHWRAVLVWGGVTLALVLVLTAASELWKRYQGQNLVRAYAEEITQQQKWLHEALVYEAQGDLEKSKELYNRISMESESQYLKDLARQRSAWQNAGL